MEESHAVKDRRISFLQLGREVRDGFSKNGL